MENNLATNIKEDSPKAASGTWKHVFAYLKVLKPQAIKLVICSTALAIGDAILPLFNRYAMDNFISKGSIDGLAPFAIIYMLLIVFFAVFVFGFIKYAGTIETTITHDIRRDAFEKLQKLSFSYYDVTPVGWIMSRLTSDTTRLGQILSWGLVDMLWGGMMMFFVAIVMITVNFKLSIIILTTIPILLFISYFFQNKILNSYRKVRKHNSQITGAFNEGITGTVTTKTLVTEETNLNEFKILTEKMNNSSVRAAVISALYYPIISIIGSIAVAIIVTLGGEEVLNSQITFGTLVLFIGYATQFFEPVRIMSQRIADFQNAQASAERVISLIQSESDIIDTKEVIEKYGDIGNSKKENFEKILGNIELKNVGFKYKTGETILENFNLNVNAGEQIAIVGPTGAGKSTIVNLICRFYEPTSGEILIDGLDYRERSQEWLYSNLGYVLQTPHLFSGTIKENIRYGKLDATDEEIIAAAKLVNAHNFITTFSDGYETTVGEGGNGLSTGQKQLISFARAILSDPSILILDEATASIDIETEKLIQDAIETMLSNRTSFIIAHRLSTIVNADRILVLKNGAIIEEGNHLDLLKLKGHYYELYTNQFNS